ncbi:MAG TPA: hypothetical protein VEG35_00270 [Burkholderiales bacterium]|nr:hypothetical protein [Burkholderiales bacterium]
MTFLADLFHYGFWGMAVVEFGKFGILGNAICSLFIAFFGEDKSTIKTLLAGTAAASCLSSALLLIHAEAGSGPVRLSLAIIVFIWLWYFIFIPQSVILSINRKLVKTGALRWRMIALRIVFTVVLPCLLAFLHAVVGQNVFGITPD